MRGLAWLLVLLNLSSLIGCEAADSAEESSQSKPSPFETKVVFESADRIQVIDTSDSQAAWADKSIVGSEKCVALASIVPSPLNYRDATGLSITSSGSVTFRLSRNGLPLATYTLHGASAISFEKSGRWYIAELGGVKVYSAIEQQLLEGK